MTRLLLAAAAVFLAAAAQAVALDCRNLERGGGEPAVLDFGKWKWHATSLASFWMQCYLKDHPSLTAVKVDEVHGLHDAAIERSQSVFEAHREEYGRLPAGVRRGALKDWKEEALRAARALVGKEEDATRIAQVRKETEKNTLNQDLRRVAEDRYESDGPIALRTEIHEVVNATPERRPVYSDRVEVVADKPVADKDFKKNWTELPGNAYDDYYERYGRQYGVEPTVLKAVCHTESNHRWWVVSPAGAQGLCQFMPTTSKALNVDPFNPRDSIRGAAQLLNQNLRRFGNYEHALAAYNAGPVAVTKYDGVPPYRETRNYLKSIIARVGAARWAGLPSYSRKGR